MTMHFWTLGQQVAVSVPYIFAIITGIFRTFYRWYISRFWWEDVWATLALLFDIVSFANIWIPRPPAANVLDSVSDTLATLHWVEAAALTSGLWAARMSMMTTIVRITSHRVRFKLSAYAAAVAFGMMWIAVLTQKMYICVVSSCTMHPNTATSQLVTDVISDVLLLALPLGFLRGVNIEHSQRVLLVASFASSILITISSIVHSAFLFLPYTATSAVLAYVKTALSLIICNLLVIVTLAYRLCRRNDLDLQHMPTKSSGAQFTSVLLGIRSSD